MTSLLTDAQRDALEAYRAYTDSDAPRPTDEQYAVIEDLEDAMGGEHMPNLMGWLLAQDARIREGK